MSWTWRGRPLRSVLVTRLRFLGDVVMSTVVLTVLRRGDPDLRVDFLCEAAFGAVLRGHPHVDRLHLLAAGGRDDPRRRTTPPADLPPPRGTLATLRALRRARYDAAVDLFFNPRSAWLLRLAGIPLRLGGPRGWRSRLYTAAHAPPGDDPAFAAAVPGGLGEHVARLWPLRHAESGLLLRDWVVREGAREPWRPVLAPPAVPPPAGLDGMSPPVVLAPGATWPDKRWPPDRWAALAAALAGEGWPVVVLQPPGGEPAVAAALRAAGDPALVLPPLPLDEALAVVSRARLLACCDGGIMHAAVALGRPVLALFGPTDPGLWFPYAHLGPYRVLAPGRPLPGTDGGSFATLAELPVAAVAAAARDMLGTAAAPAEAGP